MQLLLVKIFDFDLATPVESKPSESLDRMRHAAVHAVEVLMSLSREPIRHQELHRDEAAF
jgi:hypothetical protein